MTTEYQTWESVVVGSNGDNDATASYFVCTDDGSGLTHTVCIGKEQIEHLGHDVNSPTGSPHHRRDRLATVKLTDDQVESLGWGA